MSNRRQHVLPNGPCLTTTTSIKVRFSEVDAMGVVWHGNYARYFEEGREDFGRQYGISFQTFSQAGLYVPVFHFCTDFRGSLFCDQVFQLETRLYRQEKALLETTSSIRLEAEGPVLAFGHCIQLFTDKNGHNILTMPDILRDFYTRCGGLFCQ